MQCQHGKHCALLGSTQWERPSHDAHLDRAQHPNLHADPLTTVTPATPYGRIRLEIPIGGSAWVRTAGAARSEPRQAFNAIQSAFKHASALRGNLNFDRPAWPTAIQSISDQAFIRCEQERSMSVYMTSLDALVSPHGEAQIHPQESPRKGVLCVAVTRTCRLARFVLLFVGQVLVIAGLVLIATLSADGAHDLFIGPGAGRGEELGARATGRTWS